MTNKELISDYKSNKELVFSKQSTGEVILASSLCELVIKYLIYLFTSVFLACAFYFFYWVPLSKKGASSSPKVMTISISAQQAFLPAQTPQIANSLSSYLHNTSPLSSLASHSHEQPPAPAAQRMPRSALSPQGRTLWEEKPKTFKERKRVMKKEHTFFDSPCLPVLPRRRFDKKGARSAFPNHHYDRRDLNKNKAHDLKRKELYARLLRDTMVAYIYYCGLGQVQYNLPKLLSILSTLRAMGIIDTEGTKESIKKGIQYAVSNMSNIDTAKTKENIKKGIEYAVSNMSNVESGLNMAKQVKSISSNTDTNQKEKTTMILTDRFKTRQSNLIKGIENNPILRAEIEKAQGDDFFNFVSGGEGTRFRFKTLKNICTKDDIDHFARSYKKGILSPVRNFTLAAGYLADWDPSYPLSTGSDQFIQHVLEKTASAVQKKTKALENIQSLEDSSMQQELHFVTIRLLGAGMSCLDKRFNNAKKGVSANDVAFWAKQNKQLISESLAEGFIELEKTGTRFDHLKNSQSELLEIYFEE